MKITIKSLSVIGLLIGTSLSVGAAHTQNMVIDGGFEQDTAGDGMADHRQFSGDKGVTVTWSRDRGFTDLLENPKLRSHCGFAAIPQI